MKQEDQSETIVEDGHDILVATISNHFIGSPVEYQASTKTILINLRYHSLTNYRWYKDVFLTNVLKQEDGTQGFWKERFIASLPKLFGQRYGLGAPQGYFLLKQMKDGTSGLRLQRL